jgi:hypothetical protein
VLRFLPVIPTVPPIEDLEVDNLDISGVGTKTVKLLLDSEVPDSPTSLILEVSAPTGTTAVSCRDETLVKSASTSPKNTESTKFKSDPEIVTVSPIEALEGLTELNLGAGKST